MRSTARRSTAARLLRGRWKAAIAPAELSSRIEVGDAVFAAAETTDTKLVAKRLSTFRKAHDVLKKATDALNAAEEKVREAEQVVAEADTVQDGSIDVLANALIGIGQPRTQPFKGLSSVSPSKMQVMGYAKEAKALLALVGKVRKRKGLTPTVTAACKESERTAKAVIDALEPVDKLRKAESAARTRRNALTQSWETAYAALKRGAKSAEDDGAVGLFDTLFRDPNAKPAKTPVTPA